MPPFREDDIARFTNTGYLLGRGIIPRDLALTVGRRVMAVVADNWGNDGWKEALVLLHDGIEPAAWRQIQTPALNAALDQLLGTGRWVLPDGFGSWPILFPGFCAPPWRVLDMAWHVEGRWYEHGLDSPEIGITMIMLFSDIAPGGGGTAVVSGSHQAVARILARADHGVSQMELTGLYMRECPRMDAVEVTGEAGDVLFMHPFLVHATSLNVGSAVRIACNSRASMRMCLRTSGPPDALSPVEQAISLAIRRDVHHQAR